MKRIPIGYLELLRDLLPRDALTPEELEQLRGALAAGAAGPVRRTAQDLVRALLRRGRLEVIESTPVPGGRRLRLRDTRSRLRFHVQLDEARPEEGMEIIPLPLTSTVAAPVPAEVVELLTTDVARLVVADRVAGPREILQRVEPVIASAIQADSVIVLPIAYPPGEFWRSVPPGPLPLSETRLRDLARSRDYLLHARDLARLSPAALALPRTGSAIYIGIGDDAGGWHAVVEIHDARPGAFERERIALGVLLAGHLQTLLANTVRLQSFMFYDYVTGLYNRAYFEDQIEKLASMAARHEESFALCIVDIDDFKKFNTLYGYEGGDRVLTTVGVVLKAALRASDTIARYGGEEFAVILAPPVTAEEAHLIAERLRQAVENEPFQVQELGGGFVAEKITVSVGGAIYPTAGPGVREIWTTANRMLLDAKRMGKNRVRFPGDPEP